MVTIPWVSDEAVCVIKTKLDKFSFIHPRKSKLNIWNDQEIHTLQGILTGSSCVELAKVANFHTKVNRLSICAFSF